MAASLDHYRDEQGDHPFHQYHVNYVKYGSPKQAREVSPHCVVSPSPVHKDHEVDPLWMKWWLEECQEEFVEDELVWWSLIHSLMDGSDETMYGLVWRLLAAWRWAVETFNPHICPPTPTILNIRQFLDEDDEGHGWDVQCWMEACACALQRVGEAAMGRGWTASGKAFLPKVSFLVKAFIGTTVALITLESAMSC